MKQIFTFGQAHEHKNGYVSIEADNRDEARELMIKMNGQKWSMQYDSEEEAGVYNFDLYLVVAKNIMANIPEHSPRTGFTLHNDDCDYCGRDVKDPIHTIKL